jgi:hypothetical protein
MHEGSTEEETRIDTSIVASLLKKTGMGEPIMGMVTPALSRAL